MFFTHLFPWSLAQIQVRQELLALSNVERKRNNVNERVVRQRHRHSNNNVSGRNTTGPPSRAAPL